LVSSGERELKVWNAETGALIATVPATSRNHAPRLEVSTVTSTQILTSEPMQLFEFKG
jgi:hypothetical protein